MRLFKIMSIRGYASPKAIPWELVAPHESQALANHSQTLERLNERGGLDPRELYGVMNGYKWRELDKLDINTCIEWLNEAILAYRVSSPPDADKLYYHIRLANGMYIARASGGGYTVSSVADTLSWDDAFLPDRIKAFVKTAEYLLAFKDAKLTLIKHDVTTYEYPGRGYGGLV